MSRRWRVITTASAKASVITTDSARPRPCAPPGPPTMRPTPPSATSIATAVRRETGSRSASQAITAAAIGDTACMKRTFATVVWLSATMNDPEAIAVQTATARPARPIEVNARTTLPRSETATNANRASIGEQRAPGDLGRHVDRQLALEHACARPRDRRERHVDLATAADVAGVDHRRRRDHLAVNHRRDVAARSLISLLGLERGEDRHADGNHPDAGELQSRQALVEEQVGGQRRERGEL